MITWRRLPRVDEREFTAIAWRPALDTADALVAEAYEAVAP